MPPSTDEPDEREPRRTERPSERGGRPDDIARSLRPDRPWRGQATDDEPEPASDTAAPSGGSGAGSSGAGGASLRPARPWASRPAAPQGDVEPAAEAAPSAAPAPAPVRSSRPEPRVPPSTLPPVHDVGEEPRGLFGRRRRGKADRDADEDAGAAELDLTRGDRGEPSDLAEQDARYAQAARLAQERRQAEQTRRDDEEREIQERQRAELAAAERRRAEQARLAEEVRREETARRAEQERRAELERRAEEDRAAAERAAQERAAQQRESEQRRVSAIDIARAEEARRAEDERRAEEQRRRAEGEDETHRRRLFRHAPEPVEEVEPVEAGGELSSADTGIVMDEVAAYRDELERLRQQIAALSDDLGALDVPNQSDPAPVAEKPAVVEPKPDDEPATQASAPTGAQRDGSGFEPARVWRPGGGFTRGGPGDDGADATDEDDATDGADEDDSADEPAATAEQAAPEPSRPGADLARRLAEANARPPHEEADHPRGDATGEHYDEPDQPKAPIRRAFRRLFDPSSESGSGSGTEEDDQGSDREGAEPSIKQWLGDAPTAVTEAESPTAATPTATLPPGTDLARRLARVSAQPPDTGEDVEVAEPARPRNPLRRVVSRMAPPADTDAEDTDADTATEARAADAESADTDSAETEAIASAHVPARVPAQDREPGVDLAKRLAEANASALARAHITAPLTDRPAADPPMTDDERLTRRRSAEQRSVGLAERDESRAERTDRSATRADRGESGGGGATLRSAMANTWVRLAIAVVLIVLAAVGLRTYVVAPYYIPSASMETTLHGCPGCNNDHVLVNKLSYKLHAIHRGDVVVFNRPSTWQVPDKVLIKRVIGLSGDVITERAGIVYINGSQLAEPYVNPDCTRGTTGISSVTVPAGDVFVMGDNRCDSADSRTFGPIKKSEVIGRAFLIIWPLGRIHWL